MSYCLQLADGALKRPSETVLSYRDEAYTIVGISAGMVYARAVRPDDMPEAVAVEYYPTVFRGTIVEDAGQAPAPWILTTDPEDGPVKVVAYPTRDAAAAAWRATEGDRSLFSATVHDPNGRRALHWEVEDEG